MSAESLQTGYRHALATTVVMAIIMISGTGIASASPPPRDKAHQDIDAAVRAPEVVERFRSQATEPLGGSPAKAAQFIRAEFGRWGEVVRKVGVKPD